MHGRLRSLPHNFYDIFSDFWFYVLSLNNTVSAPDYAFTAFCRLRFMIIITPASNKIPSALFGPSISKVVRKLGNPEVSIHLALKLIWMHLEVERDYLLHL